MYKYLSANYNILAGCCTVIYTVFTLKPNCFHLKSTSAKAQIISSTFASALCSPFMHTEGFYTRGTVNTFNPSGGTGREMRFFLLLPQAALQVGASEVQRPRISCCTLSVEQLAEELTVQSCPLGSSTEPQDHYGWERPQRQMNPSITFHKSYNRPLKAAIQTQLLKCQVLHEVLKMLLEQQTVFQTRGLR